MTPNQMRPVQSSLARVPPVTRVADPTSPVRRACNTSVSVRGGPCSVAR